MKNSASQNRLTRDQVLKLPKVELHCHLELCFRHQSLLEIGPSVGLDVPTNTDEFKRDWLITEPMNDLASVLGKFLQIQKFWSSEELIERLTYEAIEDAHKQGIKILELRYAPTFIAEKNPHLSFDQIHDSILRGVERAASLDITVGLIGIIQRILPLPKAQEAVDFIIARKDSFIAMDLADTEVGFDCLPFAPLFQKAKEAGLHITVHSGEEDVAEAPTFVRNAINELGAERIGHGLQIFRDTETVEFVKKKNVVLEICPTSNFLTNAVKSIDTHPIRTLLDQGVHCTINTDDPAIFNIDMAHEYLLLQNELGFTLEEFEHCNDIAAKRSFIEHSKKQKVWPRPVT